MVASLCWKQFTKFRFFKARFKETVSASVARPNTFWRHRFWPASPTEKLGGSGGPPSRAMGFHDTPRVGGGVERATHLHFRMEILTGNRDKGWQGSPIVPVEDHSPSVSPTDFHLEGCRKAPHNTVNIICIICNIAVHPDFATNSSCFDSFTPNLASSDPDLASIAFIFDHFCWDSSNFPKKVGWFLTLRWNEHMENHRSYPGVWGGEWKKTSWLKEKSLWKITQNSMEKITVFTAYLLFLFHELQPMENHPFPIFFPGSCNNRLSQRSKRNQYLGEDAEHHRGPWGHGDDCLGLSWYGWCFLLFFFA